MTNNRAQTIMSVWEASDTAASLGKKLGVSRNAIVGYYHRNPELRTTHPLAGPQRQPHLPRSRYRVKEPIDQTARAMRREAQREARERAAEIKASGLGRSTADASRGRYTLLQLPYDCCKWPYGDDPAEITFCGKTRPANDKSYCEQHRAISCE